MKFVVTPRLAAMLFPVLLSVSVYAADTGANEIPCRLSVSEGAYADGVDLATGLLKRNAIRLNGKIPPGEAIPASVVASCQQVNSLYVRAAARSANASPVSRTTSRWVTADFNNDGAPDSLILSGQGFARQLGRATGNPDAPVQSNLGPAGHNYQAGAAADVNSDGRQDLILCCSGIGAASRLVVALGNGDGTFQAPQESIPAIGRFALHDWNRDGRQDVIAATSTGTLNIAYGQANGTFTITRTTQGAESIVVAADANNDGVTDVVTLGSVVVKVFMGQSSGAFGETTFANLPIQGANNIIAADLDGDAKLDLAISEPFGAMTFLKGTGQGNFSASGIFSVGSFEVPDAAEFDGSGRNALVLPDGTAPSLQVVPVTTDGRPLAPPLYRTPNDGINLPDYHPQRSTATAADFTGDGKAEIVSFAPIQNEGVLHVLRGGPLLNLTPFASIPLGSPSATITSVPKMASGDFNGDGRIDLVLIESETPRLLIYLANFFSGEFGAPITTNLPGRPRDFVVADFNSDSRLDVAVATGSEIPGAGRITIYYGTGTGPLANPQTINLPDGRTAHRLAVGDFNGDLKRDIAYLLIAPAGTANAAGFVLNRTNNQFQTPVPLALPAHSGTGQDPALDAIATGDVNLDGSTDILIAAPFSSAAPLAVFRGNGQGVFTLSNHVDIDPNVATLAVQDLDGDSTFDLLISHCCGDKTTRAYIGKGDGSFSPSIVLPTGGHTAAVTLADVNGDGQPELVAHTRAGVSVQPFFLPRRGAVVSAASGVGPTVAIDSIASFYGSGLSTFTESASTFGDSLRGTRVYVTDSAGKRFSSVIFFVSPGLVNFVIPAGFSEGPALVTAVPPTGNAAYAEINLARVAPSIFLAGGGPLVAANVIYVKANGQQIADFPYFPDLTPKAIDLGPDSENVVLVLYGTGIRGRTSLNNVTVTIGGVVAPLAYAGVQGSYPGFDQVNVSIPKSLAGRGNADVVVTVEGKASNIGRVVIK